MQVKRGGEGGGLLPELNVDQGEEASKRAEEEISVDCNGRRMHVGSLLL